MGRRNIAGVAFTALRQGAPGSARRLGRQDDARAALEHLLLLGRHQRTPLLVLGWSYASRVIEATSGPSWLLGYFLLIALSFLAIGNPRLAPLGGLVYAVLMGLWVGGISQVYEIAYDGIVAQALMATMAIVLVCLVLYAFGLVKVSRRFVLVVVAATLGIGLLYLTAWILSIFGVDLRFWTDPSPTGIAISVVICIVAALNLFIDFAVIDHGVSGGAPAFMEWYSAWGLLATVVWLYLEVLYLLARLRRG